MHDRLCCVHDLIDCFSKSAETVEDICKATEMEMEIGQSVMPLEIRVH